MSAVRGGTHARVAVTYFEWAASRPEDHHAVADDRRAGIGGRGSRTRSARPYRRAPRTSISAPCNSPAAVDSSGYNGLRRVIDVSGDGVNNMAHPHADARDGLGSGSPSTPPSCSATGRLRHWRCSSRISTSITRIGVVGARARSSFNQGAGAVQDATRQKLVLEIAGRRRERRVIRAQTRTPRVFLS